MPSRTRYTTVLFKYLSTYSSIYGTLLILSFSTYTVNVHPFIDTNLLVNIKNAK